MIISIKCRTFFVNLMFTSALHCVHCSFCVTHTHTYDTIRQSEYSRIRPIPIQEHKSLPEIQLTFKFIIDTFSIIFHWQL